MARMRPIHCLFAGAALMAAAPLHAQSDEMITYRVEKGDNLYTLAGRYFTRTRDYRTVQRINRIADPYRIPTGTVIRIPRSVLRTEPVRAVVHSFRGAVMIGPEGGKRQATVGLPVYEKDLIETGQRAFVTLRLPDETTVALPSQSRVRVERMRRTLLADNVERSFAIENGRARANVAPMDNPRSDFRITTPVASSAVRGTEYRVSYDRDRGRATSEVLEGRVEFGTADAQPQMLAAGYGGASHLTAPKPLLPAPDLIRPGRVQDEEQLHFTVRPQSGTTGYHGQIARDAGFLEVIDEVHGEVADLVLPGHANGTYFVRVAAIDAEGLVGQPATYGFERRLNRLTTSLEQSRAGRYRQYLFRWHTPDQPDGQYRFQMSTNADGSAPIVDEPGLADSSFLLTDIPSGTYYWRVMTLGFEDGRVYEKWSPLQQLRIEAPR